MEAEAWLKRQEEGTYCRGSWDPFLLVGRAHRAVQAGGASEAARLKAEASPAGGGEDVINFRG